MFWLKVVQDIEESMAQFPSWLKEWFGCCDFFRLSHRNFTNNFNFAFKNQPEPLRLFSLIWIIFWLSTLHIRKIKHIFPLVWKIWIFISRHAQRKIAENKSSLGDLQKWIWALSHAISLGTPLGLYLCVVKIADTCSLWFENYNFFELKNSLKTGFTSQ